MALACELPGGFLRKCGKPAAGVCKWCGRPFCSGHRANVQSKHPVCSSPECTAKAVFMSTANSARQKAEMHNRDGLCGLPACGNRLPGATCQICGGQYCPTHLSARLFKVIDPSNNKNGGEAKQIYRKVRHFVCDQCVGLVDRYGAVELPIELDS